MADVFARSASKGAARLVLLALADVANDDGEVTAYRRSHGTLARKANVSPSSVTRAIATLVDLGEVDVLAPGDGRRQTDYRITLPIEGTQDEPPQHGDPGYPGSAPRVPNVGTQGAQDGPPIIPSPSVPSRPSLFSSPKDPDRFDEFWDACPRRTGKGDARKAWAAALRVASADEVIAGMARYAAEVTAARTEPRYVKHPASWLRAERWTDEPTPAAAGRRIDDDRDGPSGAVESTL